MATKLRRCMRCASLLEDSATFCHHCGYRAAGAPAADRGSISVWRVLGAVLASMMMSLFTVAALAWAGIASIASGCSNSNADRAAASQQAAESLAAIPLAGVVWIVLMVLLLRRKG